MKFENERRSRKNATYYLTDNSLTIIIKEMQKNYFGFEINLTLG